MNIARIVFVFISATAIASACATQSSSSGSNSNWLVVCAEDSDCSGGLQCLCHVCTKTCAADGDCSGLASAKCGLESTLSVCGGPQPALVCAIGCETDDDCRASGTKGRCIEHACRIASQSTDAGTMTCLDRGNAIQGRYHSILTEADTPANEECVVDADCVFSPGLSCTDHCGLPVLSKQGAAALETQLAPLEPELCGSLYASRCPAPEFISCPSIGVPTCVAGRCWNGQGTPSSENGPITCAARNAQLYDWVDAPMRWADRSCASDDDCSSVNLDNRCYHACWSLPVSKGGAAAIQAGLSRAETELCPAFEAAGCPVNMRSCEPITRPPACLGNYCQWI